MSENLTKERQRFFLNSGEIHGVQNISMSYSLPEEPLKILGGVSGIKNISNGPKIGSSSLNYLFVDQDYFINYTGNQSFNGYIIQNKNNTNYNYSFTSGVLDSYNLKCSIGQIPEISVDFTTYGEMGVANTDLNLSSIPNTPNSYTKNIVSYSSVEIITNNFNIDKVYALDLRIDARKTPIYKIGSSFPDLKQISAKGITLQFQMSAKDFNEYRLSQYPDTIKTTNIIIKLKEHKNGNLLQTYTFNDMEFVGVNYSASVSDKSLISVTYKGSYN